jgi:hypothetical protein
LEQRLAQLEAAVTTNQLAGHVQTNSPSRASQTNLERAFDYESNEGSEPQTTSSRDPTDGMAHFIFAEEEDVGYFGRWLCSPSNYTSTLVCNLNPG